MARTDPLPRAAPVAATPPHPLCPSRTVRRRDPLEKAELRRVPILRFFNRPRVSRFLYRLSNRPRARAALSPQTFAAHSVAGHVAFPSHPVDSRPSGGGPL